MQIRKPCVEELLELADHTSRDDDDDRMFVDSSGAHIPTLADPASRVGKDLKPFWSEQIAKTFDFMLHYTGGKSNICSLTVHGELQGADAVRHMHDSALTPCFPPETKSGAHALSGLVHTYPPSLTLGNRVNLGRSALKVS